jgi:hypothetical protein
MTTIEFLGERTRERDRFELDLGDTFDVKASIVLLILTFLGTISATMLTADRVAAGAKLAQIPVIAATVISGIFCVAGLWPKDYLFDDLPEAYANWLADLGESASEQLEGVTSLSMELANGRIIHNHTLNKTKAWCLNGAFWCMALALFIELGTLLTWRSLSALLERLILGASRGSSARPLSFRFSSLLLRSGHLDTLLHYINPPGQLSNPQMGQSVASVSKCLIPFTFLSSTFLPLQRLTAARRSA